MECVVHRFLTALLHLSVKSHSTNICTLTHSFILTQGVNLHKYTYSANSEPLTQFVSFLLSLCIKQFSLLLLLTCISTVLNPSVSSSLPFILSDFEPFYLAFYKIFYQSFLALWSAWEPGWMKLRDVESLAWFQCNSMIWGHFVSCLPIYSQ